MRTYYFYINDLQAIPCADRDERNVQALARKHALKTDLPGLGVEYVFFADRPATQTEFNALVSQAADAVLLGQGMYFEDGPT